MSQPELSLRDIRVRRGKADIIKVPHLDILAGEVLVIVGPNGAGKSILLETLALLQSPTDGRVLFEGQAVDGRELALRRRMAVVFQDPLLLHRSVTANVCMGLGLRGVSRPIRRERAGRWMERFGIAHLARRSAPTQHSRSLPERSAFTPMESRDSASRTFRRGIPRLAATSERMAD